MMSNHDKENNCKEATGCSTCGLDEQKHGVPSLVIWVDQDFYIQGCNEQASDFFSIQSSNGVKLGVGDLSWPEEQKATFMQSVKEVLTQPGACTRGIEYIWDQKKQKSLECLVERAPVMNLDGQIVSVMHIYSPFYSSERQYSIEKKMIHATKMACISQELRMPMQSVLQTICQTEETAGQIDHWHKMHGGHLLDLSDLHAKIHYYSQVMRHAASQMLMLGDDMLDDAQILAGTPYVNETVFDVHAALHQHKGRMQMKAAKKMVKFSLKVSENLPRFLLGHGFCLERIIDVLVESILAYIYHGYISVSVEFFKSDNSPYHVLKVVVQDSGQGFNLAHLHQLFDYTFCKGRQCALGDHSDDIYGFYKVKRYLNLMKASLDVLSKEHVGSSYILRIPMRLKAVANEKEFGTRLGVDASCV